LSNLFKIYLPLFSKQAQEKVFSSCCQNPGLGGTQFNTIMLAIRLANKYTELDVTLVNFSDLNINNRPQNLEVLLAKDLTSFLVSLNNLPQTHFILITASLLVHACQAQVLRHSRNIIGWVHHPFQFDWMLKQRPVFAYVHVGQYQYYSNRFFYPSNWYIQNPFVSVNARHSSKFPDKDVVTKIIYLGSLFRVKGFGYVAQQWDAIKKIIPNSELHVIGSSLTYGRSPEHPLIPCDSDFANEILGFIPLADIKDKRVIFHGNLGGEKYDLMRSAHFAILNPTGASEAFPASPLECMACGLPVIASDDYGMSDSMRFFPELILRSPEEIPDRVSFLLSDRYRYEELSARSIAVASWFDSQTDVILSRWRRLFDLAADKGSTAISNCPPLEPPYGSLFKLRVRQIRVLLRVLLGVVKHQLVKKSR